MTQTDVEQIADSFHSGALRLLRRLREHDVALGLGTARASVLSVIVFGGPTTVSELARVEQVRPPTMTRLVDRLEKQGLVVRTRSSSDRRVVSIEATSAGKRILEDGRRRRVRALADELRQLGTQDVQAVARAADALLRLDDVGRKGSRRQPR